MPRFERVLAYSSLGVAVALLVGQAAGVRLVSAATAGPVTPAAVDPAKLAVCDVHQLVERLVASEQYTPARNEELAHVKSELAPLEQVLETMQKELQAASPQDPGAQEKYKAFDAKRVEYGAKRQTLTAEYNELLAAQFVEAYGKVCAESRKQAVSLGYTYIIAHKRGEMKAGDPLQIVEDFLARPVVLAPEGADITEQVRVAMKLPETGPSQSALPGSGGTGLDGSPTPAPTTPTPGGPGKGAPIPPSPIPSPKK